MRHVIGLAMFAAVALAQPPAVSVEQLRANLAAAEQALGKDHADTNAAALELGIQLARRGAHAEALPLLERAAPAIRRGGNKLLVRRLDELLAEAKAAVGKTKAPKPEARKPEAPQPEAQKPEAPKPEASKPEASKPKVEPKPETPAPSAASPGLRSLAPEFANALPARNLGPAAMGGRVVALAVAPSDPLVWYVASASGGLFKTTNGGVTFATLFDREATVSLGDVAVSATDPNVVWVGTGEANARNSVSWGDGVYKSTDGGKTWANMGLRKSYQIGRVVIDPRNHDTVYVGALGRLWGPSDERGVFKTIDGGKSWERVLHLDDKTGCIDLAMAPDDPQTLIAAMYERRRDNTDDNDPVVRFGAAAGLHKTTDGGRSWRKLSAGLPTAKFGRVGLAHFAKNPKTLFAVIETERSGEDPKAKDAKAPVPKKEEPKKEEPKKEEPNKDAPKKEVGKAPDPLPPINKAPMVKRGQPLDPAEHAALRQLYEAESKRLEGLRRTLGAEHPLVKRLSEELAERKKFLDAHAAAAAPKEKPAEKPRPEASQTPYLGIAVGAHDDGALVEDVLRGSPAAKAGLQRGDVLVKFGGAAVPDADALVERVGKAKVGEALAVEFLREGAAQRATVTLVARPAELPAPLAPTPKPAEQKPEPAPMPKPEEKKPEPAPMPKPAAAYLGLALGDANDRGVQVEEVLQGSPAAKAGLKADDVIVKIAGAKPADAAAIVERVRAGKVGEVVELEFWRAAGGIQRTKATLAARPAQMNIPVVPAPPPEAKQPPVAVPKPEAKKPAPAPMPKPPEKAPAPAYLGLALGDANDRGVLVEEVLSGSPAEQAGLKAGDTLVRIGNAKPADANAVVERVRAGKVGESIRLDYWRAGSGAKRTKATLAAMPAKLPAAVAPVPAPMPKPEEKKPVPMPKPEEKKPVPVPMPKPEEKQPRDERSLPYLGMGLSNTEAGVRVTLVAPDSPAAKAEFKPGDVIVKFGGVAYATAQELLIRVRDGKIGETVEVDFRRDGAVKQTKATLAARPADFGTPKMRLPVPQPEAKKPVPMPQPEAKKPVPMPQPEAKKPAPPVRQPGFLGVQAEDAPQNNGAIVTEIMPGGAAEKAGLQVGDRIVELGGAPVNGFLPLSAKVAQSAAGDVLEIVFVRAGMDRKAKATLQPREAVPPAPAKPAPLLPAAYYPLDTSPKKPMSPKQDAPKQDAPKQADAKPDAGKEPARATGYAGLQGEDAGEGRGAKLVNVVENGPAATAGLKPDDVVTAVGARKVDGYDTLVGILRSLAPGEKALFAVRRGDQDLKLEVTLGRRPESGRPAPPGKRFGTFLGGQVADVQDQQGPEGVETGGVFRSDDGGETWRRVNSLDPRPFYFSRIAVDPQDDHLLYVLGIQLHLSTDGGKTFGRVDGGRGVVHADHHAIWIDPKDPRRIVLGGDGGLYVSQDRTQTWDHLNHLCMAQFYHVAVDSRKPYRVWGGLQDNQSWGAPSRDRGRGLVNEDWANLGGGDGFVCAVDWTDPDTVYFESQGGAMARADLRSGATTAIRPPRVGGAANRFNWKTPFLVSRHNPRVLYAGSQFVFRALDQGKTFVAVSPELTATKTGTLAALAESPLDANVLYAGSDDGALWGTQDGGKNWSNLTANLKGIVPAGFWADTLECSRFVPGRVYAAFDCHRVDNDEPFPAVSEDFGKTWTLLRGNLPSGSVRTLREDRANRDLLYCGTEFGLWASVDRGKDWTRLGALPTVAVHEVAQPTTAEELVVATHGRGIWVFDVAALRQWNGAARNAAFHLFEPAPSILWSREFSATRYGNRRFVAPNPPDAAAIEYHLKAPAKEVKVTISDAAGNAIRQLPNPPKAAGLHRVLWDRRGGMSLLGMVRNSGPVAPGTYRVTLSVDGKEQARKLVVEPDPERPAAPRRGGVEAEAARAID